MIASTGDEQVAKTHQHILGLMNTKVNKNEFGRQRDSFEIGLELPFLDELYNAVFIRAPGIIKTGDDVMVFAKIDGMIVAAE